MLLLQRNFNFFKNLKPLFSFKIPYKKNYRCYAYGYNRQITEPPVNFGHRGKVHTVSPHKQGERQKNDRNNGKKLHKLILFYFEL